MSQLKCRIDDPATIKELPTQVVEITLFGAKTLLIQLNTDLSLTTQLEEDNSRYTDEMNKNARLMIRNISLKATEEAHGTIEEP